MGVEHAKRKKKSKLFYSNKLIMIIVFSLGKTLFRIPKSYGSIWIELIIVETENWKYCSKIIFKCVNSIMGPIFNIFKCVNSVYTVCEQCMHYS